MNIDCKQIENIYNINLINFLFIFSPLTSYDKD